MAAPTVGDPARLKPSVEQGEIAISLGTLTILVPTMPPKAPAKQKLSPEEVPAAFQRYRTELQNLAQKIGELESEMEEHA